MARPNHWCVFFTLMDWLRQCSRFKLVFELRARNTSLELNLVDGSSSKSSMGLLRPFNFNRYFQAIDICLLIPEPNVKLVFALYILIFVKNYHTSLNTLRTPAELGEPKLNKNRWGMWRVLTHVLEFSKRKSQRA